MNTEQTVKMRNYLQGAGFFLLSFYAVLWVMADLSPANVAIFKAVYPVLGLALLLVGTLLAILRNRDLSAILFLLLGMTYIFYSVAVPPYGTILAIFILTLAVIVLTAKDRSKYLMSLLLALFGIMGIVMYISVEKALLLIVPYGIIALYYSFVCMSERIRLPGRDILTAESQTDFKASGSVLGYILFGLVSANWVGVYFLGFSSEVAQALEAICGIMMILSGILLYAVAKMRFTPVMFILMGCFLYLGQFAEGSVVFALGAMLIILGLFAILRKESRILPAIMLMVNGLTYFISITISGTAALPIVSGVLNLIVAVIAVYLAFAVFAQRKLPLF